MHKYTVLFSQTDKNEGKNQPTSTFREIVCGGKSRVLSNRPTGIPYCYIIYNMMAFEFVVKIDDYDRYL